MQFPYKRKGTNLIVVSNYLLVYLEKDFRLVPKHTSRMRKVLGSIPNTSIKVAFWEGPLPERLEIWSLVAHIL